ncbi:MAG: hypothetical protein WB785_04505 [Mycobacterium sp.]|uniref:hypothetical protein n=1 Tax=Mycobacterium sp. TaxID=1785 RepID=UPI003C518CCA
MSADDDETNSEDTGEEENTSSEEFELSDEGKEKVRKMQEAYDDDRPTSVMPGTNKTITGVAVTEWLDDEGNPKFGKEEQQEKEKEQEKDEHEGKEENADQHEGEPENA